MLKKKIVFPKIKKTDCQKTVPKTFMKCNFQRRSRSVISRDVHEEFTKSNFQGRSRRVSCFDLYNAIEFEGVVCF